MTEMIILKEKMKNFYAEHENIMRPILKFVLVLAVLLVINANTGYQNALKTPMAVIVLSLLGAFLPWGLTFIIIGGVIISHIYTLSMELAGVMAILIVIMMIIFFRFTPKQCGFLLFIPLAFMLKIPFVIPILAGLLFTPVSIVSVTFGTVLFYLVDTISKNAETIKNLSPDDEETNVIRMVIDSVLANKEMGLMIIAFSITIIVVYVLRRLSVKNSWLIAIFVGISVEIIAILVESILANTVISVPNLVVGVIVSLIISIIIQFFVFSVDYTRTEHTQFEDDEYYYYVKAVPKINVTAPDTNIKRINAQRNRKK